MTKSTDLTIAIIGTKDQTALMRLAGVTHYKVMSESDHDFREKIRNALQEYVNNQSIGLIMIPDNWRSHVDDIIQNVRRSKRITTIVVEFPAAFDMTQQDVREYYKTFTKSMIGFNVEI
jgi:vacuolar-type H+-ATPase subunit F/Vma7